MDVLDKPLDGLAERGVFLHQRFDLRQGMELTRVIFAAERAADLGEGGMGER